MAKFCKIRHPYEKGNGIDQCFDKQTDVHSLIKGSFASKRIKNRTAECVMCKSTSEREG